MTLRLSTGLVNGMAVTGSFKSIMEGTANAGFYIDIYTGTRPATPDAAATGTKLARLTAAAGARLHFDSVVAAAGVLQKAPAEAWQGTGLANGTAGYFRVVTNADDGTTVSNVFARIDGAIATSGSDMNMTSTTVATNAPLAAATATFTLPTTA